MRKWLLLLCCYLPCACAQTQAFYAFEQPAQQVQFQRLLKQLRCLVCQNQDLADSDAKLAADLRYQIYLRVREQQTDQHILAYLTQRYGDFILFSPPLKSQTLLLWFAPLFFLILALATLYVVIWRRNKVEAG